MRLAERAIRAGYRINSFEVLGSTSDEAMRRAQAGDRGPLWVVAARQTGGRGRQGRVWTSPPGNLYASLLLVDPVAPAVAPQLGFVAGVALAEAVEACAAPAGPVLIKWPNDLVHGGAKLAGILVDGGRCRDGRFACALGFGVNRLSHPEGLPYPATDLFSIAPARPGLDTLMEALSAKLAEVLDLFDRGRGFAAVREAWLARALPRGTPMTVATSSVRADGVFETIDAGGRLVLTTSDGTIVIDAGDVFLMDQTARPPGRKVM